MNHKKKYILILISTTLLSACMPQVYNKTQISPRVVNVLELWSLDILFDDIFQILRNDSVITDELNFNDINFILNDTSTFNFLDSSINFKPKPYNIYDWEDSLSFKNSLILMKLISDEGHCFIGKYIFNNEELKLDTLISNCRDSKFYLDSSIWNMNKTYNFRSQYPTQYRRKYK
jgi:hypothetical protein